MGCGGLLDEHMDTDGHEDELNKRISDALDLSKRMGGNMSAGLEGEMTDLVKPKLTWQDFVRFLQMRKIDDAQKNNWNTPKRKQLFSGLFVPQKHSIDLKILLAIDTSGSMSPQQISYGVSQVAALADRAAGIVVCWDAQCFWEHKQHIKNVNMANLKLTNIIGRGGTIAMPIFEEYEKEIGEVDILIVVSDFFLGDLAAVMSMPKAKADIVWLSTAGNPNFKPNQGRKFDLMND